MDCIANITAIVLCGGLGTRLREISGDTPKPMVKVAGRPFLEYILDSLIEKGVSHAILAVCHQREQIMQHFGNRYRGLSLSYSVEAEPLGTGGAIKQAIRQHLDCTPHSDRELFLVLNGDTMVEYNLGSMCNTLYHMGDELVMSIKHMPDTERYGRVAMQRGRIVRFEEKKAGMPGFINTGVYLLRASLVEGMPERANFSFERDFLEKYSSQYHFGYFLANDYFIDIGIPQDYQRAQRDFSDGRAALQAELIV